jgi:hypothetical protein
MRASIFEVDAFAEIAAQEPPSREGLMVALAAGFAARELRRRPRRDAIVRAFAKLPGMYAARPHDFTAFRNGWIAEYRALGGECSEPETFFNQLTCSCAECAAKHAA